MATQGNTQNPPTVVALAATPAQTFCKVCGKAISNPTSVAAGTGHLCGKGLPANRVTVASVPNGYVKLATFIGLVAANKATIPGLTVSKLVKAIGNDRGIAAPAHPIAQPVYYNGVRYVHPWLATKAGLQALASGNYAKAPKAPKA